LFVNKQIFLFFDPVAGGKPDGKHICTLVFVHLTAVLMNLHENGYQGASSSVDMLRFDQPVQQQQSTGGTAEGLLRTEDCRQEYAAAGSVNGDSGCGMRVRSLSLDPPHSPSDMGEVTWQQGAEEEAAVAARMGAWRRENYQQQLRESGPSSWHGDNQNVRPPQPWEPSGGGLREQAWRREAVAVSGRYEQGGFRSGESGWQQQPPPAKEAEGSEVDPGWRLPNIPRRGQDAGWRQAEFIVSMLPLLLQNYRNDCDN
jgi:hypothetical protein